MSEQLRHSPLDITRSNQVEALEIQNFGNEYVGGDEDRFHEMQELIYELDSNCPVLHQEVKAYGDCLTPITDSNSGLPIGLGLPPGNRPRPVTEGTYRGYDFRTVYDPTKDDISYRAVHMVEGPSTARFDVLGHKIVNTEYSYVCVQNSDIEVEKPVNTHSLKDLYDDEYAAEIDRTAFNPDLPIANIIRAVGRIASRFSRDEENNGGFPSRNTQRLSYLNSLDIFNGLDIIGKDFIFFDESSGESQMSFDTMAHRIKPGYFYTNSFYTRRGREIIFADCDEAHVVGYTQNGVSVSVPVRNILGIMDDSL